MASTVWICLAFPGVVLMQAAATPRNITCTTPPALLDGHVNVTQLIHNDTYRDIVTFSCNQGYRLLGSEQARCTEEGNWTADFPHCGSVRCDEPVTPEKGTMIITYLPGGVDGKIDYRHQVAQFRCGPATRMIGSAQQMCSDDGQWIGGPTVCMDPAHICEDPEISNGFGDVVVEVKQDGTARQVAHFSCHKYYALEGQSQMRCFRGNWYGDLPKCNAIRCDPPDDVPNVATQFIQGTDSDVIGSNFTYNCSYGYTHTGKTDSITCTPSKTWTAGIVCSAIHCPALHDSSTMFYDSNDTEVDSVVNSQCADDTEAVSGDKERKCLMSGEWSGSELVCSGRATGPPEAEHQKNKGGGTSSVGLIVGLVVLAVVVLAVTAAAVLIYKRRQSSQNKSTRLEDSREFGGDTKPSKELNINVGSQSAAFATGDHGFDNPSYS